MLWVTVPIPHSLLNLQPILLSLMPNNIWLNQPPPSQQLFALVLINLTPQLRNLIPNQHNNYQLSYTQVLTKAYNNQPSYYLHQPTYGYQQQQQHQEFNQPSQQYHDHHGYYSNNNILNQNQPAPQQNPVAIQKTYKKIRDEDLKGPFKEQL